MSQVESNIIYIGKKRTISYINRMRAVFEQGYDDCVIKARGMNISSAVNVAEIGVRSHLNDCVVLDVQIGTEAVERSPHQRVSQSSSYGSSVMGMDTEEMSENPDESAAPDTQKLVSFISITVGKKNPEDEMES